jgi:hypothetical protein
LAVIKQYVNLNAPALAATTNAYGPERTIRVTPDNRSAVRTTDRVEWWCLPVGANNTDPSYIQAARRNRPSDAQPAFTPLVGTTRTGHFQTRVRFPWVGGDQYEVKVCKQTDNRDPAKTRTLPDTFETWRKIFYTVYYMGGGAFDFFNQVEPQIEDAFNRCYVELEKVRMIPTLTVMGKVNTDAADAFLNGSPGAVLNLRPTGTGRLPNHAATKPYHLATLIVPEVYETAARNHPLVRNAAADNLVVNYRLFQRDDNTTLRAADCVNRARIRWTGHAAWVNVQARTTLVSVADQRSELAWDFRPVTGLTNYLAAAAGNTYELDLRTTEERRNFVGYNRANLCVLKTATGITSALQTFTHEVGHALGQVARQENKWDAVTGNTAMPAEPNPRWHTDNFGGRGDHCWHNARLRAAPPPAGLIAVYVHDTGQLCTMFYADEPNVDPNGRFCSYCEPRLKRQNLDRTRQVAAFWNYYG